jgi:hypothetical protein
VLRAAATIRRVTAAGQEIIDRWEASTLDDAGLGVLGHGQLRGRRDHVASGHDPAQPWLADRSEVGHGTPFHPGLGGVEGVTQSSKWSTFGS